MRTFFLIALASLILASSLQAAMTTQAIMSGTTLTPNHDGINDTVSWVLPEPVQGAISTAVYDLRGRRVAHLRQVSDTRLQWDGTDDSGRVVESGVYVAQFNEEGHKSKSSVVLVAK